MLYNISELSAVYFGNIEIQEVYQGSTLIWKSAGLVTPINIYPSNNSISIPKNIEFESSAFSVNNDTDTFLGSEYKLVKKSDESVIYNEVIDLISKPTNIYPSNNSTNIYPKNIEFESSEYNSGFGYTNTKLEYKVMLDSDESVIYNDEITP